MIQLVRNVKAFIKKILQFIRRIDCIFLYVFYHCIDRICDDQILMLSDSREELSGNLYYIDRKIPKEKYTVLYFFKKNLSQKRTWKEKKKLCKAMATSKYILVDDFYPLIYPIPLSKNTKLIQVWHAMGAFKRVGFSRMGKIGGPDKYSITHRNYTDAIVSSEDIRINYAEAFRMPIENVHATGIPRTDVFFDESYKKEIRQRLEEKYPKIRGKKVILFAPTFRGNGQKTAYYPYEWIDFECLRSALRDEYIFIFKPHPFVKNKVLHKLPEDFYIDCSANREINDLLFITDILITDYSSVIFEASLLNIMTIFYVPDLFEYMESRDFYYSFEEYAFGEIATTMEELLRCIVERKDVTEKLEEFKRKFCSACDGKSSERFVRQLLDIKI